MTAQCQMTMVKNENPSDEDMVYLLSIKVQEHKATHNGVVRVFTLFIELNSFLNQNSLGVINS